MGGWESQRGISFESIANHCDYRRHCHWGQYRQRPGSRGLEARHVAGAKMGISSSESIVIQCYWQLSSTLFKPVS